jgi:hypothetical protein
VKGSTAPVILIRPAEHELRDDGAGRGAYEEGGGARAHCVQEQACKRADSRTDEGEHETFGHWLYCRAWAPIIIVGSMRRFILFTVFGAVAFAQGSDPFKAKPPAEVDQALRARIQEFFDLHVKGRAADFRKAEELVAEDTKDYFYTHEKPKYISCEISRVDYSEQFTKASAVVTCERYVMMPGFSDKPMKVPGTSTWKLVDGKWYWYMADQDPTSMNTPFGKMKAGEFPTKGGPPSAASLANINMSPNFLMAQVKMEPGSVKVKPGATAQVSLTNTAPGSVDLVIAGKLAGIEAKLDHAKLKAGEKATLTVTASKTAKAGGTLTVQVEQTTQTLPLQVTILE